MNLKGLRTKISAIFASLPTAAAAIVAQFDPQMVLQVIADYPVPLACYQGLTYIATHYYRDQAEADPAPAQVVNNTIVKQEPADVELKPQTELELEMAEEIQEGIDDV